MTLSLAVGLLMLVIKVLAYAITGSAAIYSDAAESVVHNVAVLFALYSAWYSSRPPDRSHPYGHDKIAFFSAGVEGSLIVLAAGVIIYKAIQKWAGGLAIEHLGAGIWFTAAAVAINGALGGYLVWQGKRHQSIILEANGKHVLTDSWTSLGVIVGLTLTRLTGWLPFDPICAIVVAANIIGSGLHLVRRSFGGLMDAADPKIDAAVRRAFAEETPSRGVLFHEIKHRMSGNTLWIEAHLLFPDDTPLHVAHRLATEIERGVGRRLGGSARIITHLEPREEHARIHGHPPAGAEAPEGVPPAPGGRDA
jgi:cation diffusion facilitator family transporter